jgi:hypothetical protein
VGGKKMSYNHIDVDKKRRKNDAPIEVKEVDYKALHARQMVETIRNNFEAIIQSKILGNPEATNCAHRNNYRSLTIRHTDGCNSKYKYLILDKTGEIMFREEQIIYDFCKTLISDWAWVNVDKDVFTYIKKCGLHNILANGICNFYYDNWKNWDISPLALMTDYSMLNSLMTDAYYTRNSVPKSVKFHSIYDAVSKVAEKAVEAVV